jgi:hypothetical protein
MSVKARGGIKRWPISSAGIPARSSQHSIPGIPYVLTALNASVRLTRVYVPSSVDWK